MPTASSNSVKVTPADSIEAALAQIPNGGILLLEGEFKDVYNRLRLNNRCYTKESPLVIDGQNKTIHGPKVDVQDSQWIFIKNMELHGGVGFNNSLLDEEKCLQHITFENVLSRFGQWFAGGYTYHHITLRDCIIQENIYSGNCTHQIYFSGGHWSKGIGLTPPHHINVINCKIRWCGGRHGIQVNGRFTDVNILGNTIYCHAFTGFQGIGIERCKVEGNTIFACNRGALNIYDYDDQFWWEGSNPQYFEWWKGFHHSNKFWVVRNNTLMVPQHSWCNWYDGSKPDNRPAILVNNEVDGCTMADGTVIDYKGGPHWICDNLIVSPWSNFIEFDELSSAGVTYVKGNYLIGASRINFKEDVPIDPHSFLIQEAEAQAPNNYSENLVIANDVKKWPEYPDASEIPPAPDYDWSKQPMEYDFYSPTAAKARKGAIFVGSFLWSLGGPIRANVSTMKKKGLLGAIGKGDTSIPKNI